MRLCQAYQTGIAALRKPAIAQSAGAEMRRRRPEPRPLRINDAKWRRAAGGSSMAAALIKYLRQNA